MSQELPIGTLVKDEQFTLFESVGALEIMDPKMDSGFLAPGETLEDEYDITRPLLPEEIIGIMDQLLCCEMSWHEGYPLAQTLFTSHYIDKLLSTESKNIDDIQFEQGHEQHGGDLVHVVLRAYCIGLIKCCDYALDEINRSLEGGGTRVNFYEEEDFSGHTYGRELFTGISKDSIIAALYEAEEVIENEAAKDPPPDGIAPVYAAIKTRIEFRIELLLAMFTDEQHSYPLDESWMNVSAYLPDQYNTHHLGKAVPESFSPKIQRRLASTVPPKPMVELSYEDAFKKLQQMCLDCREAVRIVDFGLEHVQRLKAFLWSFNSRKPEPLSYPRACLSAPLFGCDDVGFEQLLRRDLEEVLLPNDPILDPVNWTFEAPQSQVANPEPRYEMANAVNRFTQSSIHMAGGYIDLYRSLCSNRCRLRRNLCHVVLALEEHQTRETEPLDEIINHLSNTSPSFPLSTWTYLAKLQTMTWIVQLGFELDIYLPDELAGMYWYLSLLAQSQASVLKLILPTLHQRVIRPQGSTTQVHTTISYLESRLAEMNATKSLADALFSLYTYLRYLNKIPDPASNSPFYNAQQRYELRMKPFLDVTGATVPPFAEYSESITLFGPYSSPTVNIRSITPEYLSNIDTLVKEAKAGFASVKKMGVKAAMCEGVEGWWMKNVNSVLASCVAAGIAVSAVRGRVERSEEEVMGVEVLEPGKRYHDWWVVPKIS
ncbi:Mak10-domain-containing protein [Tothia fuscella]|uniref:Mak10-domain-containing protein n=1 Tax=Tothia fuscella TaxID=1048955 RepID=A0A9P4U0C2_9PEZI|nr:Mak10-domain-containing protein [Tothia fuscella]